MRPNSTRNRMIGSVRRALSAGTRTFIEHPQLWFTVLVAASIFASYVYVANSFVTIARDAQDQLINVRIGSLQDAFAPLAGEVYDRPDTLRLHMQRMQELNPTIVDFSVVVERSPGEWVVLISTDPAQEASRLFGLEQVLGMAKHDTANSYTIEESSSQTRYFRTVRAVVLPDGSVPGVLVTKQSLSEADARIGASIRTAVIALAIILLVLLVLFFRHARIIDYATLYRKLRDVDTLKDEFLGMASHELRAPLTAIRGYIDLLRSGNVSPEKAAEWMERIDLSAASLDNLVADMLDVSRIQQGRMSITSTPTDAAAITRDVIEMWRVPATEKGLTLSADVPNEMVLMIDPERLRQVLTNLVSNAVKYTKQGSVVVRLMPVDGRAVIRVSDTGIGMTTEEREHLFAKFYRAGGADVRAQRGTGLGLWITKQLVELMGGAIAVESIKDVGTHFVVSFPLPKHPAA